MADDAFDRTLTAAADSFFLLPDAVWIDYLPAGGTARRIKAIIDRMGAVESENIRGGEREAYEITVKNSTTAGVSSAQVDTGGDKVKLSPREGMRPVKASIVDVLDHDAAMMRLKVI